MQLSIGECAIIVTLIGVVGGIVFRLLPPKNTNTNGNGKVCSAHSGIVEGVANLKEGQERIERMQEAMYDDIKQFLLKGGE